MPQRRSSRKAAHNVNDAIKLLLLPKGGSRKSWVDGARKKQAVGSSQAREFDSASAVYLPGSETEIEDEDMCVVCDDEGLVPTPSNRISANDWDEE